MNAVVISLIALFSLNAGQTAKTSHENIDKEWKTFKVRTQNRYNFFLPKLKKSFPFFSAKSISILYYSSSRSRRNMNN